VKTVSKLSQGIHSSRPGNNNVSSPLHFSQDEMSSIYTSVEDVLTACSSVSSGFVLQGLAMKGRVSTVAAVPPIARTGIGLTVDIC
jgi:hypothetical protein